MYEDGAAGKTHWVTIKIVMPSAEHLGNQFGVKCGGNLASSAELHDWKGIMVWILSRFPSKAGATR